MWELDHEEGWTPKNWCFWTVVLEKTLDSPLDNKEIKADNPEENQPWIVIERSDAEAEAPILCPPDGKSQLTGKMEGRTRRVHQRMNWLGSITHSVNYKSALDKSICQWLNKNKSIFHLPLQRRNPSVAAAADLQHSLRGIQAGEWGTLYSWRLGEHFFW